MLVRMYVTPYYAVLQLDYLGKIDVQKGYAELLRIVLEDRRTHQLVLF